VVPYTRGRERSRDPKSIEDECLDLLAKGYKEVSLLGQNVDSYKFEDAETKTVTNFAQLLERVALLSPDLRVRFSTSHPKDITDEVLYTIKKHENICKHIHLPAQSGNDRILKLMNRTYDRAWYINRIDSIKSILGEDCAISHDMITGFCSETEEEHQDTLSLMQYVQYDFGFMFSYSERPGTPAAKKYPDDISKETKQRRLEEIIALQQQHSLAINQQQIGKTKIVLVESLSKRSDQHYQGRADNSKQVVFPKSNHQIGDYVRVKITSCTTNTLMGESII
ncbi:MAG: MiaB/RimO family radical SAM methylthiotransferase, partial [Pseudarcicella sp.]|nr:MiaB/RimO family radical SAM methylthiotransferase [Pseudarcicella sp.]